MNAVDATAREAQNDASVPPSLLTIVLDTNPHAWALLHDQLAFSKVIANLLVFINAHLAINNANRVAVIASHVQRAQWLYPTPRLPHTSSAPQTNGHADSAPTDPNKYRPFAQIESTLTTNIRNLLATTTPADLLNTPSTLLAGALTLALCSISKSTHSAAPTQSSGPIYDSAAGQFTSDPTGPGAAAQALASRILLLSVSGDLSAQYIPLMNAIFACQRLRVPIDVLKLAGDAALLQQAADATGGVYLGLLRPDRATDPKRAAGLLQYLFQALLPDPTARRFLLLPGQSAGVDFRAACFCHRRIVNVGFVCSICLSIFCEPLQGDRACLTCGTELSLGNYGTKPVVVAKKKKAKKRKLGPDGREYTPASTGPGTPGPS